MYVHYIPPRLTPDRGFCGAVCNCKINHNFYKPKKYAAKHIWYSDIRSPLKPLRRLEEKRLPFRVYHRPSNSRLTRLYLYSMPIVTRSLRSLGGLFAKALNSSKVIIYYRYWQNVFDTGLIAKKYAERCGIKHNLNVLYTFKAFSMLKICFAKSWMPLIA